MKYAIIRLIVIEVILLVFINANLFAQISEGGIPKSFSETNLTQDIPTFRSPIPKISTLLAEDAAAEDSSTAIPWRFGQDFDVELNLYNSGIWETLDNGDRIWRLSIHCAGAYSVNLIYDIFWLPEGAKLFLYNSDKTHLLGAFTSMNNREDGLFATSLIKGESCTIEYYEPVQVEREGLINISKVIYGYRDSFSQSIREFGDAPSENVYINCPEGNDWQSEKKGVVRILAGSGWCSGSLINNTSQDKTPYLLTANHCIIDDPAIFIYHFNYESPTCNNAEPLNDNQSMVGSALVSRWANSDFALLQLTAIPPRDYEPFYNGWSKSTIPSSYSTSIHHPGGNIKEISIDDDPAFSNIFWIPFTPTSPIGSHWRVFWDVGRTAGGSSGSPLFNQYHRIVGQLHGALDIDLIRYNWYGKFDKSWDGGGTSDTRLRDWLDPNNSDVTTLIGLDPYANDPLYISINRPFPKEVWIAGSTQSIKWTSNAGGDVAITLWKDFSYIGNIESTTSNDGVYSWNIPSDLASSTKYQIKIISYLPNVIDGQSDLFTIIPQVDYYIDVTVPDPGDTWFKGDQALVSWGSNKGNYVSIEIFDGTTLVRTLESTYPNNSNNEYLFIVQSGIPNGSNYKVKVTSKVDGSLFDYSGTFSVANHPFVTDELIVNAPAMDAAISPANDEDWYSFRTMLPGTYFIETHGSTDTYMYLYQSDGSTLIDDNNDGGVDLNAKIADVLDGNTLYYVLVHEDGYNATGNYSIDVIGTNLNFPHIVLDPQSLNFNAVINSYNPIPKSFSLTNSSDGILNWSIIEDLHWLRVDNGSGNSNSQQVTAYITSTNLPVGTYNSTIQVSSNNADNSPQYVNIEYQVSKRCINGSMFYNTTSKSFNFCENGLWLEKGLCGSSGTPSLVFPFDSDTDVTISPTFDWDNVSGASTYLLTIDDNNSFSSPEYQLCSESQFSAFDMYYSTTHYWRVKVFNDCGGGDWSNTWSFTTKAPSVVVNIPDANLEAVIRTKLVKPLGDITSDDMATIDILDCNFKDISNLTGLEYCSNITNLMLSHNNISDLSPVAGLTTLTYIGLGNNNLTSFSDLSGLVNLEGLSINDNNLTDISALSSLTKLQDLFFDDNNISDISVLSSLPALTDLFFDDNNVVNISPLSSLINLKIVGMDNNLISDIYPLTQNSGLGTGDDVYMYNNPLSSTSINTYIPQLEANGCDVHY